MSEEKNKPVFGATHLGKEDTFQEIEDKVYKNCMEWLEEGEEDINMINLTLRIMVAAEKFAYASGIKRAIIDFISDKYITLQTEEEIIKEYNKGLKEDKKEEDE